MQYLIDPLQEKCTSTSRKLRKVFSLRPWFNKSDGLFILIDVFHSTHPDILVTIARLSTNVQRLPRRWFTL